MGFKHPLQVRREEFGFSLKDISILAGLSETTLRRIEKGSDQQIKYETAEIIAKGLDTTVEKLFKPRELTKQGRMPQTGTKLKSNKTGKICPKCRLEIPRSANGKCEECQ